MNQNNRICIIQGHEKFPVFHICTFNECNNITRWCCPECISKGIHHHNKPTNSHIMNTSELLNKLMSEQDQYKKKYIVQSKTSQYNLLEKILQECQQLEKSLLDYRNYIEKQIQNMASDEDQARFEQYMQHLDDNNFQQLDDDKLNQLLNINQQKLNQENYKQQLSKPLNSIKQYLNQIEFLIQEYQDDNKNIDSNQIIDQKKKKYTIQYIDFTHMANCGSSISKNEQYLAYGVFDKSLKIYNIKIKKIIKEIKLDNVIYACQFTSDSSQLFVGLNGGYVQGFDVQADFKEIYKQQVHSRHIYNIITIQNQYLITCSHDQSIIKTDVINKQQIFKLTGHTDWIVAIDYNDKDEIIVSGSGDQSIKLWNCRNQSLIISKEKSHNNYIRQIQLVDNNLNILSLDWGGILYKWKIDVINKDLIQLQQFSDENKIFNFYQVNQDQNLMLICNKCVKILNQQGETLNTIDHDGQNTSSYDCRQLDNLKYIQIIDQKKIILAIAQD